MIVLNPLGTANKFFQIPRQAATFILYFLTLQIMEFAGRLQEWGNVGKAVGGGVIS
jgi:hypothetical protein